MILTAPNGSGCIPSLTSAGTLTSPWGALRADGLVRQGRAQLRQVVIDGHRHGLSQRRIAGLTGRSQPEVGRLVRETNRPAHTWLTARDAAEAIKGELDQSDADFALRTLIGAINDFRGLCDHLDERRVGSVQRRIH